MTRAIWFPSSLSKVKIFHFCLSLRVYGDMTWCILPHGKHALDEADILASRKRTDRKRGSRHSHTPAIPAGSCNLWVIKLFPPFGCSHAKLIQLTCIRTKLGIPAVKRIVREGASRAPGSLLGAGSGEGGAVAHEDGIIRQNSYRNRTFGMARNSDS